MKRRILIPAGVLGILVLCLLVLLATRSVLKPEAPLTRARFDSIHPGSTLAEIEGLLGRPGNRTSNMVTVWTPQAEGLVSAMITGTPDVVFFPNVTRDTGYELVWLDECGLIAASFDNHDQLQNKYFSDVHNPGRPTFFDWVRTRF